MYKMTEPDKEAGIIQTLAHRLETQRLPRALALKKMVDGGERLNDLDIEFLDEVFSDMRASSRCLTVSRNDTRCLYWYQDFMET